MLTCPEEWITGKKKMTPDEAIEAGVLSPDQVKGRAGKTTAPPEAQNTLQAASAPQATANPNRRGAGTWRRIAANLLGGYKR